MMLLKLYFKSVEWMEKNRKKWWLGREDVFLRNDERNNHYEIREHWKKEKKICVEKLRK